MTLRSTVVPAILCIFLATTCGKQNTELTIAVGGAPHEVEYWEQLIDQFMNKTQIPVKLLRQPTDTDQRRQGLVIPLKAKKENPDVFLMDVIWVGQFAASEWLLPLESHLEPDIHIEDFFTTIVQQIDMYDGHLVALPVYNDCGILYYRKDLLEKYEHSTPSTWQELVSIAEDIQQKERKHNPQFYGFVWQGAQYEGLVCAFLEFSASHGGGITEMQNGLSVMSTENIAALQFMHDLIHVTKISPPNTYTEMKEEEVRLFFENGNALFERNWPYAWGLHQRHDSPLKGKVGITTLPRTQTGKSASALGGWHIGISRYTDMSAEAVQLLKYVVSYETQKRCALNLGWNPGRSDIYIDQEVQKKMLHLAVLHNAFENAVARPNIPYYTQLSDILQRYLNAALSQEMPIKQALLESEKEIKRATTAYHE